MARNDGIRTIPITVPKEYDPKFIENLIRLMWDTDLRSGIGNGEATTGNGYFLGFTSAQSSNPGVAVFIVGDLDNNQYMRFDGSNLILSSQAAVKFGSNSLPIPYGIQSGTARDGDTVTFDTPYDSPPTVIFGMGGKTYESTIAGDQYAIVQALGLDETGFTMSAKLSTLVSGSTSRSLSFTGGDTTGVGGNDEVTADAGWGEAFDDNYTFQTDVTLVAATGGGEPAPSSMKLGFYTKPSGGSYTLRATRTFYNYDTGSSLTYSNFTKTVNVDGLGASAGFKIQIISTSSASNLFNGDTLTYEDSGSTTTSTMTDASMPGIPWLAIGT